MTPAAPRTRLGVRSILTLLVLIICLAALGFAQSRPGQHLVRSLGIAAPREPYTEMFFVAPGQVANQTEAEHSGTTVEPISFVIVNQTHTPIYYRWSASVASQAQKFGITPLGPGQRDTITTTLTIACPTPAGSGTAKHGSKRARPPRPGLTIQLPATTPPPRSVPVVVSLAAQHEQIRYLFGCDA